MNNTTVTSIRIFTHQDIPTMAAVEAQATELAFAHGLSIEFVRVDDNPSEAITAGVMALPAIIAYSGDTEVARRECALAGRGLRRWFDRKLVSTNTAPALIPAMA